MMQNIPIALLEGEPIHPGEDLGEMLDDMSLSCNALGKALGVPPNRISEIVAGRRDITADTAFRLARYFNMSVQYWLNLQQLYDLAKTYQAKSADFDAIKPMQLA